MRVYKLDSRSIWEDETFTLLHSTGQGQDADFLLNSEYNATGLRTTKPLPSERYLSFLRYNPHKGLKDIAISILTTDTQPPLFFIIMHFWMRYFGATLFSLRFLSVLFSIGSIICAFLFASKLFSKRAGIFSALFIAVSPFVIFYAREMRHYSLILTIALLSSYLLVRFKKDSRVIFPIGFILSSALGLYTHYFYIFILLAHAIYFLFLAIVLQKRRINFVQLF